MSQLSGTPRGRRIAVVTLSLLFVVGFELFSQYQLKQDESIDSSAHTTVLGEVSGARALDVLAVLEIKGRAPSTGYARSEFGDGWAVVDECDTRNRILFRDLHDSQVASDGCKVLNGLLEDPYTGKVIQFMRGEGTSDDVQIDHVVALSDAWQKGAQGLSIEIREAFANDPLNLLAVDGPTNIAKGNSDAASWLPPNKLYRCRYVARQIAVKSKYGLWITRAEYNAMDKILSRCSEQRLPESTT